MDESSFQSSQEIEVTFYSNLDQQIYPLEWDWGFAALQELTLGSDSRKSNLTLGALKIPPRWIRFRFNEKENSVEFVIESEPLLLSPDGQLVSEGVFYLPQTLLFPEVGELRFIKSQNRSQGGSSQKKISGLIKDRYRVLRILGEGGFSHVALARDEISGIDVAIKVIHHKISDNRDLMEKIMDRFFQEMKILMQIDHPHLLKIQDYGFDSITWSPFYVMEYVDGKTLMQFINQFEGEIRWEIADLILEQLLQGLSYLHSKGVVHRDLKPENILVAGNYPHFHLKILDLGLAKMLKQQSYEYQMTDTKEKESFGTPPYMSPEQCLNAKEVLPASDVYSVAILVCMIYSNRYPYEMDDQRSYEQVHVQDKPSLSSIRSLMPMPVLKLIEKCLNKDPLKRPRNASEMQLLWVKTKDYLFFDFLGMQMKLMKRQSLFFVLMMLLFTTFLALIAVFFYRYAQSHQWIP